MPETWIRPNRRALAVGFLLPAFLACVGACCLTVGTLGQASHLAWRWLVPGGVLMLLATSIALLLWRTLERPRLAYARGELLLYFNQKDPFHVPVNAVECFFIGQAGGMIPNAKGQEAEVRTVILRLAESEKDWHHRDISPRLGHWCEGYITLSGTWCEPITPQLMQRLNSHLIQAHREAKRHRSEGVTA